MTSGRRVDEPPKGGFARAGAGFIRPNTAGGVVRGAAEHNRWNTITAPPGIADGQESRTRILKRSTSVRRLNTGGSPMGLWWRRGCSHRTSEDC
jgi:hypothetical protein